MWILPVSVLSAMLISVVKHFIYSFSEPVHILGQNKRQYISNAIFEGAAKIQLVGRTLCLLHKGI
jgi:hypothetical protein